MKKYHNIVDDLLDEDNQKPIALYGDDDQKIEFEKIFVMFSKDDGKLYCILKPIDPFEDLKEDEALVFRVDDMEAKNPLFTIEENDDIADKVFDKYYKKVDE